MWAEPFVPVRLPKIFENANIYWDWALDHIFVMYPMQAIPWVVLAKVLA